MELEFLVLVLCSIGIISGESETWRLPGQSPECGKELTNNTGAAAAVKHMPWIVTVVSGYDNEYRSCHAAVISPFLVITSRHCVSKNVIYARFTIHFGLKGRKSALRAHLIEDSPFLVLEVSVPFPRESTVCLPPALDTKRFDSSIWTASWGLKDLTAPSEGSVCLEQWTPAKALTDCHGTCSPSSTRCTCALPHETPGPQCQDFAGTPVLRWSSRYRKWYLVGLFVQNNLDQSKGHRELLFQSFTTEDSAKIGDLLESTSEFVSSEPDENIYASGTLSCGRAKNLRLGPHREIAPFLLPWVVAIRATLANQTLNCVGTIIDPHYVLTTEKCHPQEFKNAPYKIIYNSTDLSTGIEISVENISKPKALGPSFIVLKLAASVDERISICLTPGPFAHHAKRVVAAFWAFHKVGKYEKNQLYYEDWTLSYNPDHCDGRPFPNEGPKGQLLMCGLTCTKYDYVCRGDLGQPIMYWFRGNWYLVGMLTHLRLPEEDCELRETRRRVFEWVDSR